ncbi:methylated-DNA--[protein]-cysteine S-methyltransferase [Aestuariivita boseongensis]|uniref:methylated-DNA--[protein]-cysteine S-methyltransferase n=1 Tax=Aestuariivita boseongensis TaxID=1470562 RepID=UPI000682F66B|nr:methylated-DNA--[protein]-cysteine S-methyltransferase [Aestuariivita boseongensis]
MAVIAVDTQFGRIGIEETDGAITRVMWDGSDEGAPTDLLKEAARQLSEYDKGTRTTFDLPFRVSGSAFQQAVCNAMLQIPFGETRTYGDIAKELGQSAQAVGTACGGNPIPILIPCHRVMGAGGKLTGFSGKGGVETKVALLRHEGAGAFLI